MENGKLYSLLLDSWNKPVVFVDTGHIIRYMNKPAKRHYSKWGDMIGKSIFQCHNPDSCKIIKKTYAGLEEGAREILFVDSARHRVFMRAVRDESGALVGYYERYDPSAGKESARQVERP